MDPENRCPACNAELAANAPRGLCPACLLKGGLETQTRGGGSNPSQSAGFVPPTPAELAPLFPELEILELLGQGGMGVVYKARQKRLDRFVALKILSPKIGQDPAFAERFNREARAMAMLSHPHVVAVYDFGQTTSPLHPEGGQGEKTVGPDGGLYFFIMEFVDGVNVRRLLDTGKLTPGEALAIVPQICDALQFAHDHGVVHRDIKPENLLLDKEGRVKIADFGLAKLVGPKREDLTLSSAGQVLGTPHYMAPEQIEHPLEVDHRADIYSLGVVFYQMLTGELPIGRFAAPSKKVLIDVRLDEVVLRALEKEPGLRYQQASEIRTDVESIVTTLPALPAGLAAKEQKWQSPTMGWGHFVGYLFGITFTSPLAYRLANLSALGFLACLAFLSNLPFPGARALSGFAGFAGLFGAIGVAFIIEMAVRHRKAKAGTGSAAATPTDNAMRQQARRQVQGPAIGLVVTSVVNWLSIFVLLLFMLPFAAWKGFSPDIFLLAAAILAVGSALILTGALRMQRLESLKLARLAGIAAMIIGPGYIIGWPIGIWSLVVLARPEVVAAFRKRERNVPQKGLTAWMKKILWVVLLIAGASIVIRVFVLANYYMTSDALAPEIPQGSYALVFKLARNYSPGDIAAYRTNGNTELGRVIEPGPKDERLLVQRRNESSQPIPAGNLIGKVILNTRAEHGSVGESNVLSIVPSQAIDVHIPHPSWPNTPAPTPAPEKTAAASSSPANAEVDRVKFQYAELQLKRVEAQHNAGAASEDEYLLAKRDRDVAAAEMEGDQQAAAKARFQYAEKLLAVIKAKHEAGAATDEEYLAAQRDRDVAAVKLQELPQAQSPNAHPPLPKRTPEADLKPALTPPAQADPRDSPRAADMRTIVLAALEYATEHPEWPKTLDELTTKYLDAGKIDLGRFVYHPLTTKSLKKNPQEITVLTEKVPAFPGGRLVGFADGYIEFIQDPRRRKQLVPADTK